MPTFRRPELLQRALRSLQRQSVDNWMAIVLDDSAMAEARPVVESLSDPRISYRQNALRLGAAGNLDAAFAPAPLRGGDYGFVLEDDNALEPDFIAVVQRRLAGGDVDIVSVNQLCVHIDNGAERRGARLRESSFEEQWTRDRLYLNAFLGLSLPNGGYVWRFGREIDLTVGKDVAEPQLQECIRQTRVPPPIALLPEPMSLWSMLPADLIRRRLVSNRRLSANLTQLSVAIASAIGPQALITTVAATGSEPMQREVDRRLSEVSLLSPRCRRWFFHRPAQALRSTVRWRLYRDQIGATLARITSLHG